MARFVLALLLILAGTLVLALAFGHQRRKRAWLGQLRAAFLHGSPMAGHSRHVDLREAAYGGGVLRFRVPAGWVEESDPQGGAMFHDRSPDPHALRLNLLTLEHSEPLTAETVAQALGRLRPEKERAVETLPSGNVLMKCLERRREGNRDLVFYIWQLGRPLPPRHARLAVFSLAVLAAKAGDVIAQSDVSTLEREIRNAEFSAEVGASAQPWRPISDRS